MLEKAEKDGCPKTEAHFRQMRIQVKQYKSKGILKIMSVILQILWDGRKEDGQKGTQTSAICYVIGFALSYTCPDAP